MKTTNLPTAKHHFYGQLAPGTIFHRQTALKTTLTLEKPFRHRDRGLRGGRVKGA